MPYDMRGSGNANSDDDQNKTNVEDAQQPKLKWDPTILQTFGRRCGHVGLRLMRTVETVYRVRKVVRVHISVANINNNIFSDID